MVPSVDGMIQVHKLPAMHGADSGLFTFKIAPRDACVHFGWPLTGDFP